MLAADKLQLQSAVKQKATALKEKEFILHRENLMTVGTQAAVLAGLDITMFIEFTPAHESEWSVTFQYVPRIIKFFYYSSIVSAFCANILVVGQTSFLSVLGASLALRGPDGSMMTATDGIYEERKFVFQAFGYGLIATVASVVLCVWLILTPEAALVCMFITSYTVWLLISHYKRVKRRFAFDEDETIDFTDLFDGPGAIRIRKNVRGKTGKRRSQAKYSDYNDYGDEGGREMDDYLYEEEDEEDLEEQGNLIGRRTSKKLGGGEARYRRSKKRDSYGEGNEYEEVHSTDPSEEDLPSNRRRTRQQNPYSLATV